MPDNRTLSEKLASHISDPLLLINTIAKHIDENEQSDLNEVTLAMIGQANGVAGLDGSGKVPSAQLPSGGGGGGAWGDITGTLADQTDLQAALDLKLDIADLPAPNDPKLLLDSDDDTSVDGDARQAYDSSDATSLDWQSRRLMAGGVDSVHYGNRTLGDAGGNVVASWDADGLHADAYLSARTILPTNVDENKNLHSFNVALNPDIADAKQSWTAKLIEVAIGTDDSGFKVGDPVDIKGSLVEQDITYTGRRYGTDNNVITIEYTAGATAGAEVVSKIGFDYTVQIEDGVSTAAQIIEAFNDFAAANGNDCEATLSGTGSDPQVVFGPTNLAGGVNAFGTTTGQAISIFSRETSNAGNIVGQSAFIDWGNGTDPISARNISGFTGNINIHDNADVQNATAFEFSFGVGTTNSSIEQDLNCASFYGNVDFIGFGLKGVNIGLSVGEMLYANIFQSTMQVVDVTQSVNVFADFSNYSGTIGNSYYGLTIQPNLNEVMTGFTGVNISPNVDLAYGNSYGINVNMANVTVYAGVKASLVLQDLTYEWDTAGTDGNNYSIEYIDDATAGSETAGISGNTIQVHMEDGVSTAQQIVDALDAFIGFGSSATVTITGTASDPQTAVAATPLAGGINPGNKKAAYFGGDVQIDGALAFSGALAVGALTAFQSQALVDGGGTPTSAHTLITQPTVAASATLTSGDFLGVNTAMLLNVGANATVGTAFLGVSALGLPAVVQLGANATVDRIAGATFAISMDAGSGAGSNIGDVALCQALALPNGITTIDRLYGYQMRLPFGDPGTATWGVYIEPAVHNFMAGGLKIGSGTDTPQSGYGLHVEGAGLIVEDGGDVILDASASGLGFFATGPVAQQASSGAVSAGGTYTATEQTMIQEMYNALRAYGLLT